VKNIDNYEIYVVTVTLTKKIINLNHIGLGLPVIFV